MTHSLLAKDTAAPTSGGGVPGVLAACLIVAVIAFACYVPTMSSEFVRLDDYQYVIDNPLVRSPSWSGVFQFFAEVRHPSTVAGYYQPLTMTTLCLDAKLSGVDADHVGPFVFHLTNIMLHAVTTVLVLLLIRVATGNLLFSALAAVLFAVHPAQVESVAWISQRKTVLATPLALGAILAYLRTCNTGRKSWLAISFVLYILANLAKPTVLLLPLVLPLLDVWPLKRPVRKSLLEKWPFAMGMVGFGWIAVVSQSQSEAQMGVPNLFNAHIAIRWVGLLCYNAMLYLGNLVWPARLSPIRALPDDLSFSNPVIVLSCLGVIGLIGLWLRAYRAMPSLFMGLAAFVILLSPAMGPIRFFSSCVSDRFLYLPIVFLLLPLADSCSILQQKRLTRPTMLRGAFVLVIAAMSVLSIVQQSVWANSRNLWTRVEDLSPDESTALGNLALFDLQDGKLDDALRRAERAVSIAPQDANARHVLGRIYCRLNRGQEAVEQINKALELGLGSSQGAGHISLAEALLMTGDMPGSDAAFQKAIALGCTPEFATAELGEFALRIVRNSEVAARYYRQLVEHDPDNVVGHWNLGTALESSGRPNEAMAEYERVREIYKQRGEDLPSGLAEAMKKLKTLLEQR